MSGAEPLDTGTAIGRLMLAVIGAVGQAEREPCSNGRERASQKPRRGPLQGPCAYRSAQADEIIRLKEEGVRPSEIASRLGIGTGKRVSGAGRAA